MPALNSGNVAKMDEAFFAGTHLRSNVLCNSGCSFATALFQHLPKFRFDEVCEV
ncbi:MAG: hypothetical protein OSA23_01425 [Rhodospirillales bacterium]|nr:hypothetical protein [Rhodospirillales bacterium]